MAVDRYSGFAPQCGWRATPRWRSHSRSSLTVAEHAKVRTNPVGSELGGRWSRRPLSSSHCLPVVMHGRPLLSDVLADSSEQAASRRPPRPVKFTRALDFVLVVCSLTPALACTSRAVGCIVSPWTWWAGGKWVRQTVLSATPCAAWSDARLPIAALVYLSSSVIYPTAELGWRSSTLQAISCKLGCELTPQFFTVFCSQDGTACRKPLFPSWPGVRIQACAARKVEEERALGSGGLTIASTGPPLQDPLGS